MRFVISFAEQCFGSILTFAINCWLIRYGSAGSYGVYVFWLAIAWVLGTAQGTLVIAHLFRLPSALDHQAGRRDPERLFLSVSLGLLALATAGALAGNLVLSRAGSTLASPAAPWFIGAFLLFQYVRAFAFSRQRTVLAACLTGGILLLAMALLVADLELGHRPDATRVLGLTALAYGGVSVVVLLRLLGGMAPMVRPAEIRQHGHLLHGSGWLLLGAGSGEVTNRLYSFATVGRFGSDALGALSAVQVVIRPAWMLSAAWASIGFPQLAARRTENDRGGFLRTMQQGAISTSVGSIAWSALVIVLWPLISALLYRGRYAHVGWLPYLWGANVLAGSLSVTFNTAMLALGEYRRLAVIDLCGALATMAGIVVVVLRLDYPFAVAATVLGQSTQIVLMAARVRQRLQGSLAEAPEASTDAATARCETDEFRVATSPDPALQG